MAVYRFADFVLNEEQRTLLLAGTDIPLQPRIFDLLSFLVRNRQRVVSKDELLSALWPGVFVTESSLQRAVSLARKALRQGGLENAIRNIPRHGYRFCPQADGGPAEAAPRGAVDAEGSPVAEARSMMAAQRWSDAVDLYRKADEMDLLGADDLDALARAVEYLGRPAEAIHGLGRAVAAHAMGGQPLKAAMSAMVLAKIHLERGETDVAKGWHQRADRMIGGREDAASRGYWCWMGARIAGTEGDPEQALALSQRAYDLGRDIGDPGIEALGLIYRGFYRICLGRTRQGLEDQNHAAAIALGGPVDPITGGIVYCNILWSCRNMADWSRAGQWANNYTSWCAASGISTYPGACELHNAEVLAVRGILDEAERRLRTSLDLLPSAAPWAEGDGYRILGDIRMAKGDLDGAEAAYETAFSLGWQPQPGHALLLLERGQGEAALRGLERALDGRDWLTLQRRGYLLAHLAWIAARVGDVERAKDAIAELEDQADRWSTPSIRALTAQADAVLLAQGGDRTLAVRRLEDACSLWQEAQAPLKCAEARLAAADMLIDTGDPAGAELEAKAALAVAERFRAPKLMDAGARLLDRLPSLIASGRR